MVAFIEENIPDFACEWNSVLLADGYYFLSLYPGEDALLVKQRDVENCRKAVEVTREAVLVYMNSIMQEHKDAHMESDDDVLASLEELSHGPCKRI